MRRTAARAPSAVEAAVAPGDLEARRQALDVPLPRPRQGLVEVVDVEDQPPVGGGEDAEVRQVGVAAHLHPKPGLGRRRQVGAMIAAAPR